MFFGSKKKEEEIRQKRLAEIAKKYPSQEDREKQQIDELAKTKDFWEKEAEHEEKKGKLHNEFYKINNKINELTFNSVYDSFYIEIDSSLEIEIERAEKILSED